MHFNDFIYLWSLSILYNRQTGINRTNMELVRVRGGELKLTDESLGRDHA